MIAVGLTERAEHLLRADAPQVDKLKEIVADLAGQ
jgi:hypothetical protein